MVDDKIKLIGLSGAIDVGKSIVAKHWCDSYGCAEFIFKNVMVQCLAHIFEVDGLLFHDRELKENPHDSFVWPLTQGGDADLWH